MAPRARRLLVVQALWELLRYDILQAVFGFRCVHSELSRYRPAELAPLGAEDEVRDAVACALTLYWKRVRCLQRACVTARLLRRQGVPAELVVGFRHPPFLGHAWVEIEGRVVGDSQAYKRRLYILDRT